MQLERNVSARACSPGHRAEGRWRQEGRTAAGRGGGDGRHGEAAAAWARQGRCCPLARHRAEALRVPRSKPEGFAYTQESLRAAVAFC